MSLDWTHGIVGGLVGLAVVLGRAVYALARRPEGGRRYDDRGVAGERLSLKDVRDELRLEIREVGRVVTDQAIATARIEQRVTSLERRDG